MIKHTQQRVTTRQHERRQTQENAGFGSGVARGSGRGEEVALRVEAPGYGGAALSAVVPAEAMAEIEGGDRPVDTNLKIRVPGYGWRVVRARVLPRTEEGAPGKSRRVRLRVPGYGGSTMRMTFAGR